MSPRLRVDVTLPLHRFTLEAAFETGASTLGLFGPSGAGKTTLLEAIAGLRRHARGRIEFDGETWLDSGKGIDRPPEARGVGYVPQDSLLFPHWDVEGNVLAGRGREGPRRSRRAAAPIDPAHVMAILDIENLRARRVGALSGGERQRVALARALCSAPALLLLDEPLGSIEAALRSRILPYLIRVRDEFGIPTIYVSHEPTEVSVLCGEVIVIREGKVIAQGRPADVFTSHPERAGMEGAAYENVLEGTIASIEGGTATVAIPAGHRLMIACAPGAPEATAGARVLFGVRAGDLMIAVGEPSGLSGLSARNILSGAVRALHETDGGAMVIVSLGGDAPDLAVMITDAARVALALKPGLSVRLVAKAQSFRVLAIR